MASSESPEVQEGQVLEPLYSIVVPVYKNEESLPTLLERIALIDQTLGGRLETVFVVDGSPDGSLGALRALAPDAPVKMQVLSHSRNFGSFAAIRTGLEAAKGEYVAVMAADMQEPPELVLEFFEQLSSGDYDVAVGTRTKRDDPGVSTFFSRVYWSIYRRFVQPEMPSGGVDIFGCTKQVARTLGSLSESNSSLVGLLLWVGYRRIEVPYVRERRLHGTSAWSVRKKLAYLLDSVFSFSSLPISLILSVGLVGAVGSLLAAFVVFLSWAFGAIAVEGYAALMLVLLFATGSILFALGIVGTYVWRSYENTKGRPGAIVMSRESFNS